MRHNPDAQDISTILGGFFAVACDWGQTFMTIMGLIVGIGGLILACMREWRESRKK